MENFLYKSSSLAKKRHHRKRIKNKVSKYYIALFQQNHPTLIGKLTNHGTLCSCFMCGNPRKYFNLKTLQELKQEDAYKAQLKDLEEL